MVNIHRVRAVWTGFPGAPGVSTFYCLDGPALRPLLHGFFEAVNAYIPNSVAIDVEMSGETLNPLSGELVGAWTGTGAQHTVGDSSDSYAAPAGALVHWLTDTVIRGHRLRGRTFLVPWASGAFDQGGTIATVPLAAVREGAEAFVTAAADNLVVWSRPQGGNAGAYTVVTSSSVPDKAVVLRSRRD